MGRIFDAVRAVLDEDGIRYDVIEGVTALRFGFRTEEHQWACLVEVREQQDLLLFVGVVPGRVDEARRAAVGELLHRINYGLAVGNFELDFDDGEARFRTSVDFEGSQLAPGMIRQVLRANLASMSRYLAPIVKVASGQAAPVEALATVR